MASHANSHPTFPCLSILLHLFIAFVVIFSSFSLCFRSGCLMYKDRPGLCLSFYPLDYRPDTSSSGCLEALYYIIPLQSNTMHEY